MKRRARMARPGLQGRMVKRTFRFEGDYRSITGRFVSTASIPALGGAVRPIDIATSGPGHIAPVKRDRGAKGTGSSCPGNMCHIPLERLMGFWQNGHDIKSAHTLADMP